MIKPKRLKRGDTVAIVSLSWGGLGESNLIHRYEIAKKRLENQFGLRVKTMPHALKGSHYIYHHPEKRAQDLMDAFEDTSIDAIFCAIGGDDTIRILPYIDFNLIRQHPKIFMGYSDSTINHFMMYHAGMVSFYGPSIMVQFGAYVNMIDYTIRAVEQVLFQDSKNLLIESSPIWSDDFIPWEQANEHRQKKLQPEQHGYEWLQGSGIATGHLIGGCIDVFHMVNGTSIWPTLEQWQGSILFFETSEDKPEPNFITYILRNLAAQGILRVLNGIVVGKPQDETYYEEYKQAILSVVRDEEKLEDLIILYNVNIGHAEPIGILPLGIQAELNSVENTFTLLESATLEE